MGRAKKRKLWQARRMLALILTVTMAATMVPATAYAAPGGGGARGAWTGEILGEADGLSDLAGNGMDCQEDSDTGQSDSDTAKQESGTEQEDSDTAAQGPDAVQADTEKPVYQIATDALRKEAVYTGSSVFDLNDIKLYRTLNGQTEAADASAVISVWQVQGADGNYTAMAADAEPVRAGRYKALFSFAEEEGVHDGAEAEAVFEIKKAPVTVHVKDITVKPGSVKGDIEAEIDWIETSTVDSFDLDEIVLTIVKIRHVFGGSEVGEQEKLRKDGDYVLDILPAFQADASQARQEIYANYELAMFTADVKIGEPVTTRVELTLAQQWQAEDKVLLKVYDKKAAKAPVRGVDYDQTVRYLDEEKGWVVLDGAELAGEWAEYSGCLKNEEGVVEAPTDAGEYTYRLVYRDRKGEYAESYTQITAVIDPAPVTVVITNGRELTCPAGMSLHAVLSQVTYKVYRADNEKKEAPVDIRQDSIWGTGYDDANVTQIYEPLFTLQVKEGEVYQDIEDADYKLQSGKEYRVVYKGEKAVYNADGSYAHRTTINSGIDEAGEEINGADSNYHTDETPTADDKALKITVQPGTEVDWQIEGLLKKGGRTPEEAQEKAKEFDNTPIYYKKAEYKNAVRLTGNGRTIAGTDEDITYTWYVHTEAEDLLDKEIMDRNQANGFRADGFYDDDKWAPLANEDWTQRLNGHISPTFAGIYKLVIDYEDKTDDGTYYYLKEQEPAVVYYIINKVALQIMPSVPADGAYSTLSGRSVEEFFRTEEISYQMLKKDGTVYRIPDGVHPIEPFWAVNEKTREDDSGAFVVHDWYGQYDDTYSFVSDAQIVYEIQARDVQTQYFYESVLDENYTTNRSVITETGDPNASGQKKVERAEEPLGGTAPLTVKPVGTLQLTPVAEDAAQVVFDRVYDGTAVGEDITAGLVKIARADNGQQIPVQDLELFYGCERRDGSEGMQSLTNVRDAGEYDLYVYFGGDETYAPFEDRVLIGTGRIRKRPLTFKIGLPETYEAGITPAGILQELSLTVEGYAAGEEWAFVEDAEGATAAWSRTPEFRVFEKGNQSPLDDREVLPRHKAYEVHYASAALESSPVRRWEEYGWYRDYYFERNYEITARTTEVLAEFGTVTAPARIISVSLDGIPKFAAASAVERDKQDDITQTVEIQEGIDYSGYSLGKEYDYKRIAGNLTAFRISAPAQFEGRLPDTAMYQNEVEKSGGYVVSKMPGGGYFTVLFDASEGIAEGTREWTKSFSVRWEDDYIETFVLKFEADQMLGNLQDAVAPKALAFNAPSKKMSVGSSQQLDVKITKAQMRDVVWLGYESSDEQIMRVNENGNVTVLKRGKATITVYARHMDENGTPVPIRDAKGKYARSATVVIEGLALPAPKPVKITAHGTYAVLDYSTPKEGYRREIYVVDNKANPTLKKAADIERRVQAMKNGQWKGTFAIEPVYLDSADEMINRNHNRCTARLTDLETTGQYTVYVRNVCAVRTLADGSVISQNTVNESAAGTAISFKTRKSEMWNLHLNLGGPEGTIRNITDFDSMESDPDYIGNSFRVELAKLLKSKGTIESIPFGEFFQRPKDPAADADDRDFIQVPFNKQDSDYKANKAVYEEPKLEYALNTEWNWGTDPRNWAYGPKNDYAAIDKKGRIKITGANGESLPVVVRVRDTITGYAAFAKLYIVADADFVAARKKTVNLTVGQWVDLNDSGLYVYQLNKKKLTDYRSPHMAYDKVKDAIKEQKQEAYFRIDQAGNLYAVGAGGRLDLVLQDSDVARTAGESKATVRITFKSTALMPVKQLRAYDLIHDRFGLTFTYPDRYFPESREAAFRLEITEGSGKKIVDKQIAAREIYRPKEGIYRIDPDVIQRYARYLLAKESKYKVTVTAMYGTVSAKGVSVQVRTTKIPARVRYLEPKEYGGMPIAVSEDAARLHDGDTGLRILSGNAYTLTAEDLCNRGRVNDTLTWTISDGRTASVKAAAGSFCITLKGLKPGSVTLEVKSKILGGKVVARYMIDVVAVGDAYKDSNRYYGDNEPEHWEDSYLNNGGDNAPEYLPLSVGDLRKATQMRSNEEGYGAGKYGYSLFSFTVPESGQYRFSASGFDTDHTTISLYQATEKEALRDKSAGAVSGYRIGENDADLGWLTAGETIYLRTSHTRGYYIDDSAYYVGIEFTRRMQSVDAGGTVKVTGRGEKEYFRFTAAESGYYRFSVVDGQNRTQSMQLYLQEQDALEDRDRADEGDAIEYYVQEGVSVWLSAELKDGREYSFRPEKISMDMVSGTPLTVTLKAGETKYLISSVSRDGYYRFASGIVEAEDHNVSVEMWVNGEVVDSAASSLFQIRKELKQGDEVCLRLHNAGSAQVVMTVSDEDITPAGLPASAAEEGIRIAAGSEDDFYRFTASASGAYRFRMTIDINEQDPAELTLWENMDDVSAGDPLAVADVPVFLSATGPDGESAGRSVYKIGLCLQAGQTVYINPCNRTVDGLTAAISVEKEELPVLEAGKETVIDVQEIDVPYYHVFSAPAAGTYVFTADHVPEGIVFRLYRDGVYVAQGSYAAAEIFGTKDGSLHEEFALEKGEMLVWAVSSSESPYPTGEIAMQVIMTRLGQ